MADRRDHRSLGALDMTRRRAITLLAVLPFIWTAALVIGTAVGVALAEANLRRCSGAED